MRTMVVALLACLCAALGLPHAAGASVGPGAGTRTGAVGFACLPSAQAAAPATAESPTFTAVLQAPLPTGWVDREFLISCVSPGLTYKTALFVRMPADARRAGGIVAVDPLHRAGIWGMQTLLQPYFVARGDVHVGVAASHDVVEQVVKGANPTRYASLHVPDVPGATNEILAGVGALLHRHPELILPGVHVREAILGGWSQTAVVTRAFIGSPQSHATIDGRRVFDGYFPGQAAVGSSGGAQVGRVPDIGVPVLELQGERELLVTLSVYGSLGYRRPDSRTYRLYEVAGMSHINNEPDNPVSAFAGSLTCDWPAGATPSAFRQTDIWEMAFDNLVRWVSRGTAPPHARRIELDAEGAVRRDAHGNARGGVRSVFVDVPTASIMPTSLAPGGVVANPCAYVGYQLDFSPSQLQQLYPTHRAYVHQVKKDTDQLVRERFLLRDSARQLVAAARRANIPPACGRDRLRT
jgi:alpha/beta hydrolase family protein